ncbi:alpha/beta hydrolase [Acetobacter sp.]|uniref:alpha/beta hydrolase n=1 Tax=Acetobacter sp. TaxID=440 RepID=UPI0025B81CF0|nr:lipase family protein [Acetobacter sp.]MCH4092330.1 lipase [Acetobacter sp.]MCI1300994.1 lipase [Acetobacter sp.]MCI1317234.1 lipase [Acetobacter sp.]
MAATLWNNQVMAAQVLPSGDGGVSAFYKWDAPLPAANGIVLRQEPYPVAESGYQAYRLLYSARDGLREGQATAVSGVLYVPTGKPPTGGWPVVAWAHGTTGVADVCAPSWRGSSPRDMAYFKQWLDHGFAVFGTDYQGLGTPGVHPYLLYRPEGYSILDGVRAVLKAYPHELANSVVLAGQSQGSGAALGAAYLAPSAAPDLHIVGVIASGLVLDIRDRHNAPALPEGAYQGGEDVDAAYSTLYFLGSLQGLGYPGLFSLIREKGHEIIALASHACLHDLMGYARNHHMKADDIYYPAITHYETLAQQARMLPDAYQSAPVFTATGLADAEAGTIPQYNVVAAMCSAQDKVEWHYYPDLTHSGTVNAAFPDELRFVTALREGRKPVSNCHLLHIPGPIQEPDPHVPFNY